MSKIYRPVIPIWIEEEDMRLIDADALIKNLDDAIQDAKSKDEICDYWEDDRSNLLYYLDTAPTIDAVEVVHGEWIVKENHGTGWYRITCSECGEDVTSTAPCIGFMPIIKVLWNYCPECGAKMDGGTQGE